MEFLCQFLFYLWKLHAIFYFIHGNFMTIFIKFVEIVCQFLFNLSKSYGMIHWKKFHPVTDIIKLHCVVINCIVVVILVNCIVGTSYRCQYTQTFSVNNILNQEYFIHNHVSFEIFFQTNCKNVETYLHKYMIKK